MHVLGINLHYFLFAKFILVSLFWGNSGFLLAQAQTTANYENANLV